MAVWGLRSWASRLRRRVFPERYWSGAGTVVEKVHWEPNEVRGSAVDWLEPLPTGIVISGHVPARWLLAVRDEHDETHYMHVDPYTWFAHEVGDEIAADEPLENLG